MLAEGYTISMMVQSKKYQKLMSFCTFESGGRKTVIVVSFPFDESFESAEMRALYPSGLERGFF